LERHKKDVFCPRCGARQPREPKRAAHRLPVRFLIYVAITALTRLLTIDIKDLNNEQILTVTGAILVLALAALAVDFSAARFRSADEDV